MNPAFVSLRVAPDAAARQAVLRDWLATVPAENLARGRAAAIVEGALAAVDAPASVSVEAVGGCFCCVGQVALQVALTRVVRARRPSHLLLLIASGAHRARVRRMLDEERFAMLQVLD